MPSQILSHVGAYLDEEDVQGTGDSNSKLEGAEPALLSPCPLLSPAKGILRWLPCGRRPLSHMILPTFDPDLQCLHGLPLLFVTTGSNPLLVHGKSLLCFEFQPKDGLLNEA